MNTLFFTIAMDEKNLVLAKNMIRSFKKFHKGHSVTIFTADDVMKYIPKGYEWNYRLTPLVMNQIISDYDCLVRLDADQIITGNLEHVIEGEYDVAVVDNSSPRDWKFHYRMTGQMLNLFEIDTLHYLNCGFVAVKSKRFIRHWFGLCQSRFFPYYQFREQDMLNILVYYFDYQTKFLDKSNKWHGLKSKGYWPQIRLKDGKLILPKNDEWPTDEDKEIVCLHPGGGNFVDKFKDFNIRFTPEVATYLKGLIT